MGQHPDCLGSRDFSSSVTQTLPKPAGAVTDAHRSGPWPRAVELRVPGRRHRGLCPQLTRAHVGCLFSWLHFCPWREASCLPWFDQLPLLPAPLSVASFALIGRFLCFAGIVLCERRFLAPFLRDIICHHQGWIVLHVTCDCTCVHPKGFPAQSL